MKLVLHVAMFQALRETHVAHLMCRQEHAAVYVELRVEAIIKV